ncbi:MAG: glycosyltransferase [Clostridiales bacterium]|nr:glycosyltransferase [Clostridiales bacterium]
MFESCISLEHPPKITICMPVYNVAPYLEQCLQSVVEQTFDDFILIAVNDGSTDNSLEILQRFAAQNSKLKIINQENQGMSAARNKALSLAESEYVCFLDSDDHLAPTYLEELYEAAEQNQADISCCYFSYHFLESNFVYKHPFRCKGVFDSSEALKRLLKDTQIQSYAWNKLYKRTLFVDHNISYPSIAFEDIATTHRLFFYAKRVAVIDRSLYYYVQRKTSTLGNMNTKVINDFIRAVVLVRIFLSNRKIYPEYRKTYEAMCRKTNLFCKIWLCKIHWNRRSWKDFNENMKKCTRALRYYSSEEFCAEQYFTTSGEVPSLPDVLPHYPIKTKVHA